MPENDATGTTTSNDQLRRESTQISLTDPLVWIAVVLFVVAAGCVLWTFYNISIAVSAPISAEVNKEAPDAASIILLMGFSARLMQVTLGILVGLVATLLGTLLAWYGVTGKTDVSFDAPTASTRLVSAGPGALLVLCGMVLVGMCVVKDFTFSKDYIDGNANVKVTVDDRRGS